MYITLTIYMLLQPLPARGIYAKQTAAQPYRDSAHGPRGRYLSSTAAPKLGSIGDKEDEEGQ